MGGGKVDSNKKDPPVFLFSSRFADFLIMYFTFKGIYLRNVRPKQGVMFFPSGSSDNPNLASERRKFSR